MGRSHSEWLRPCLKGKEVLINCSLRIKMMQIRCYGAHTQTMEHLREMTPAIKGRMVLIHLGEFLVLWRVFKGKNNAAQTQTHRHHHHHLCGQKFLLSPRSGAHYVYGLPSLSLQETRHWSLSAGQPASECGVSRTFYPVLRKISRRTGNKLTVARLHFVFQSCVKRVSVCGSGVESEPWNSTAAFAALCISGFKKKNKSRGLLETATAQQDAVRCSTLNNSCDLRANLSEVHGPCKRSNQAFSCFLTDTDLTICQKEKVSVRYSLSSVP